MTKRHTFAATLLSNPEGRTPNATGIAIPASVYETFGTRGRVPVRGTINGFPFRSSIGPYAGKLFMPVSRLLREGAGAKAGDSVRMVIEKDDAVREVVVPTDLQAALGQDPRAEAGWAALSYTHRKEWVQAVEDAKGPETRARRIANAVAAAAETLARRRK